MQLPATSSGSRSEYPSLSTIPSLWPQASSAVSTISSTLSAGSTSTLMREPFHLFSMVSLILSILRYGFDGGRYERVGYDLSISEVMPRAW